MKKLRNIFFSIVVISTTGLLIQSFTTAKKEKMIVQVALLLDTSGSMEGLIEQAKSQLWKMVNELTLTKYNGETPEIELALYEYGKNSLEKSDDFIRQVVFLTTDLDQISEELFKLQTNGGDEYCGSVIHKAVKQLRWSNNKDALKVIFIAGNEPFTQGNYDYKNACNEAVVKNIIVNTIYCGNFEEGVRTHWKDGANLAEGKYMNINHNQPVVHIETPQDKALLKLNEQLNKTYIAYGSSGRKFKARQMMQDENAKKLNKSIEVERTVTKSSSNYQNSSWDLVDATKNNTELFGKLKKEELPHELKGKSEKEIAMYVEKKRKERKKIQILIQKLSEERRKYVNEKYKEMAENETLDNVIISTVLEQANEKGLEK